jgi:hypothetical protein
VPLNAALKRRSTANAQASLTCSAEAPLYLLRGGSDLLQRQDEFAEEQIQAIGKR